MLIFVEISTSMWVLTVLRNYTFYLIFVPKKSLTFGHFPKKSLTLDTKKGEWRYSPFNVRSVIIQRCYLMIVYHYIPFLRVGQDTLLV